MQHDENLCNNTPKPQQRIENRVLEENSSPQFEGIGGRILPHPGGFSYQDVTNTLPPLKNFPAQQPPSPQPPPTPLQKSRKTWTSEDDNLLRLAVEIYGDHTDKWSKIAACVPNRTNKNCRKRWFHSLDPSLRKGPWTPEEDDLLTKGYEQYRGKWSLIAKNIPGRTDDQCAKRWRESLNPEICKQQWTAKEDELLRNKYNELGSKWQEIAKFFPGRPGLHCRNRWRKIERSQQNKKDSLSPSANEVSQMSEIEMIPQSLDEASSSSLSSSSSATATNDMTAYRQVVENDTESLENSTSLMDLMPMTTLMHDNDVTMESTNSMLSEISPTSTTIEETLTTSTASSNPSISSLLSPSVSSTQTAPHSILEIMDPPQFVPSISMVQTTPPPPPTFTEVSYSPLEENSVVDTSMEIPEIDFDHSKKPYGCGIDGCTYTSNNANGLFYHSKSVHPEAANIDKPFQCAMPGCHKRYKNINGLEYHLNNAKGSSGHKNDATEEGTNNQYAPKPYECRVVGCKKSYKNQNGLTYHLEHAHNNINNSNNIDASRKSIKVTKNNTSQSLSSNNDSTLRTSSITGDPTITFESRNLSDQHLVSSINNTIRNDIRFILPRPTR
ncbi:11078_t:CDS:2 [Ambispora gerdemannii]|uniref:11078_t:CDS:1 n=1 Tax=Ambispora gerdemannii TaxID=144530 RepID=A0A9N8YK45_9GLOM|nr:11078_t:CDS:2 [Ambispora gerdemannii]